MHEDYKFLSDERKSRLSSQLKTSKYKHPERKPPQSQSNKFIFTKKSDIIPGAINFAFKSPPPIVPRISIEILTTVPNQIFGFGIETNSDIDLPLNITGTVDWGQGDGPEIWSVARGDYSAFTKAYSVPDEYYVTLEFDTQEGVARLELDSSETNTSRSILSITGLQVLQSPYQIDLDRQYLSTLDLGNIPSLIECWALDNQLTYLNLLGSTGLTDIEFYINRLTSLDISGLVNLDYLLLYNNEFTEQGINSILIALDQYGLSNGRIELYGPLMALPSGAGITAKNNLIAKGWNVQTN